MNKKTSFLEVLVLLKEVKKRERKKLFRSLNDYSIGVVPYLFDNNLFGKSPFLSDKKIYYKYQIKRRLKDLDQDAIDFFNNIYSRYLNRELLLNDEIKKQVRKYFGKTSNVRFTLQTNYYYIYEYLNIDYEMRNCFFMNCGDYYFSRIVSNETRNKLKEQGILKLKDLEDKKINLNQIEYSNVCRYIEDLNSYYLNDSLFISLLNRNERELFDLYLEEESYLKLSKIINFSTTEARARIYSIIKKLLEYFDSYHGIRALDMMFAYEDCQISIEKLKEIFPKYYKYIKYLAQKKYLYKMEFINKLDIIVIK